MEEYRDARGWTKGDRRVYVAEEETRIVTLKQKRIDDHKYLQGAEHVQMDYAKKYPHDRRPSLWFIGDVFRTHALQTKRPKPKRKKQSIVERLKFPIRTIVGLGRLQQSVDFVGKKFIAGRSEPIALFSTCYYQWLKRFTIWRTSAETVDSAVTCLTEFWTTNPIADVCRMDNGMQFRGTGRGVALIGHFVKFLLNLDVIPLFSAPYQSYTNPHIEGNNRTVSDLWTAHHFTDVAAIDHEIALFNAEHEEFYRWHCAERLAEGTLRFMTPTTAIATDILRSTEGKNIYFIRFVERWKERGDQAGIVLLNRFVATPVAYIGQYVLACIHLETATLSIAEEHDGIASTILTIPYPFRL